MSWSYLLAILISFCGMFMIDWRYRLAFWAHAGQTLKTISAGVMVFVIWDALGLGLGIFFSGKSPFMSGIYLWPDFPIEELFFLAFLCYFTLILYLLGEIKWRRT